MKSEVRNCLSCEKPLKGRIDKKFCDDYCRNNYNNKQKLRSNYGPVIRNTNNALLKNRKVLENILADRETTKSSKEKLVSLGFQFKYVTDFYTNQKGDTYYYCYDYGYLPLDSDWYLIVRKKQE